MQILSKSIPFRSWKSRLSLNQMIRLTEQLQNWFYSKSHPLPQLIFSPKLTSSYFPKYKQISHLNWIKLLLSNALLPIHSHFNVESYRPWLKVSFSFFFFLFPLLFCFILVTFFYLYFWEISLRSTNFIFSSLCIAQ